MGRRHFARLWRDELLIGRRAFVAGTIALITPSLFAAKSFPPPKVGAIRWPGHGGDLHGFMAVPAKAHGPQPAVLVLPDAGADPFALGLTDALALAGFVACVAKAPLTFEEATATLQWLGTNPYATGKVGIVGIGAGAAMAQHIAAAGLLACAVLFDGKDDPAGDVVLHLPMLTATKDALRYEAEWRQAIAFLAQHLHPDHTGSSR